MTLKGESPLQKLVRLCEDNLPTKVKPKLRTAVESTPKEEITIIDAVEIIEESKSSDSPVTVNNFIFSLNLDLNSEAMQKISEDSIKLAKGLAAGAAVAMIGTAALFLQETPKKVDKVKIPLLPRTKIPKTL